MKPLTSTIDGCVKYMSRLRACGPVIPGIPQLAGVDPARYASGRYGDQVHYGDGILFFFGQAHALDTPKGGRPCPLGTLYYLVVGHLDSRLCQHLKPVYGTRVASTRIRLSW